MPPPIANWFNRGPRLRQSNKEGARCKLAIAMGSDRETHETHLTQTLQRPRNIYIYILVEKLLLKYKCQQKVLYVHMTHMLG